MDALFSEIKSTVFSWADRLKFNGMLNADTYINSAFNILEQRYAQYGFAKKGQLFSLPERQVFIYTRNLNSGEINFLFDMRVLNDIPPSVGQAVPMELFQPTGSKKPGMIVFSPVPNISLQYKMNTDPITVVPFYLEENRSFLVIDGNHRVSQALQMGKKDIRTNALSAQFIYQYIHGPFEQALYLLADDINTICNSTPHMPFQFDLSQSFFLSKMRN